MLYQITVPACFAAIAFFSTAWLNGTLVFGPDAGTRFEFRSVATKPMRKHVHLDPLTGFLQRGRQRAPAA